MLDLFFFYFLIDCFWMNSNMLGGGDVKHQDDRQSDVGEASSTTSQDHPSHHDLLTEGEEEHSGNRDENASNLPPVEGVKIEGDDKHEVEIERNAIQAEREFKIEHDENERKSYDGGSSGSSSSSSSDDESHRVETSHAAFDKAPVSVEGDHYLHKENIEVVPSITIGEASDAVVDSIPPVVSDKVSLLSESVEDGENNGYVQEATVPPVEKVPETSDPKKCAAEETDERLSLSYNVPIATHDNGADTEKDSGVTEVQFRFSIVLKETLAI